MTLAERLVEIANMMNALGTPKEADVCVLQPIRQLMCDIAERTERKVLMDCLNEAVLGRTEMDFGRNPYVPESLKNEGFWIRVSGPGFHLCFGPKPENSTTAKVTA